MPIHLTRRQLLHRAAVTGAFAALSRTALGAELGRTPRLIPWRNWSGGQSCLPAARLAPQSLDELERDLRTGFAHPGVTLIELKHACAQ